MLRWTSSVLALAGSMLSGAQGMAHVPSAIAAPGETAVATLHAEGAQIYECKVGADGTLAWAFREPIASLFLDGRTVGRHYAGPSWERTDGSAVVAKVAGKAPGKTADDIDWLKLEVTSHRGTGALSGVTTVQRVNTNGGVYTGACDKAGALHSFLDGRTVGRHYAGPSWERTDGSAVVAKVAGKAPGKTADDIDWLKLEVTSHRGTGALSGVTTVQRVNTNGGVYTGACDKAGALHSAPYAADYVFLEKAS